MAGAKKDVPDTQPIDNLMEILKQMATNVKIRALFVKYQSFSGQK
ncbi:MAG TPA: hypothetical protein VI754_15665 [Bacteriovoracaceae bacterium]|nr:hypothetical protein [Bacteriovoracaceae bacterium]